MSLDVYLEGDLQDPESCPHCFQMMPARRAEVFHANITHNLNRMAEAVELYSAVWRDPCDGSWKTGLRTLYDYVWHPEHIGVTQASQLIEPLEKGIQILTQNPSLYKQYSAPNDWGTYDQFIPWLRQYLAACKSYPNAEVRVSR